MPEDKKIDNGSLENNVSNDNYQQGNATFESSVLEGFQNLNSETNEFPAED